MKYYRFVVYYDKYDKEHKVSGLFNEEESNIIMKGLKELYGEIK